jgi:hypothetical protein
MLFTGVKGPQVRWLGSRVTPRGLGFDPLVGRILSLGKKILSLCLVRSRVPSPVCHSPAWAVVE